MKKKHNIHHKKTKITEGGKFISISKKFCFSNILIEFREQTLGIENGEG